MMREVQAQLIVVSLGVFIAAGARSQIYVGDENVGVYKYSISGQLQGTLPNTFGVNALVASGDFLYVGFNDHIAQYTLSGTLINPSYLTGLNYAVGFAFNQDKIYVASIYGFNSDISTVGEYTTAGATVNASLITNLRNPIDVVTDGNYLYVSSFNGGTVGKYTMDGQVVNTRLIRGLSTPGGLALDGAGDIFVSTENTGVLEYTTSGVLVNASVIPGEYNSGIGLSLYGNDLYDANDNSGIGGNKIDEYTTDGQVVSSPFISVVHPTSLLVVPEPSSCFFLATGLAVLILKRPLKK